MKRLPELSPHANWQRFIAVISLGAHHRRAKAPRHSANLPSRDRRLSCSPAARDNPLPSEPTGRVNAGSTRLHHGTEEVTKRFGSTKRDAQRARAPGRRGHPLLIPRSQVRSLPGPFVNRLFLGHFCSVSCLIRRCDTRNEQDWSACPSAPCSSFQRERTLRLAAEDYDSAPIDYGIDNPLDKVGEDSRRAGH